MRHDVERAGLDLPRIAIAEQNRVDGRGAVDRGRSVHPLGHVPGELSLDGPRARVLFVLDQELLDLLARLEREQLQVPLHVPVVGVHPELIELVRRRERGIEIDRRPRFRLAELGAGRRGDERVHETVRFAALETPDQVDSRRDVPPLVAAAHLQGAPLLAVQVQKVVRLQQHVTELGV